MNTLPTFFDDFLKEIRPTKPQRTEYKDGHKLLRERLAEFDALSPFIISTFLQGSYRRATAVRPKDGSRSDVDVVVVTNFDSQMMSPKQAMDKFIPFLEEYYPKIWEANDRSFTINLSSVKLDLVITAAPNPEDIEFFKASVLLSDESIEEMPNLMTKSASGDTWKIHPLLIPDRSVSEWRETHPIAQIEWTWAKNDSCNTHYVNVVKALKWWRKECHTTPKYPKGYPLEHMIGQCCPDDIESIAEGVTITLEEMATRYRSYAQNGNVPELPDHGVSSHNVLKRVTPEEFKEFHEQVESASKVARSALDEASKVTATQIWQQLFGGKFPIAEKEAPTSSGTPGSGGFTPRTDPSVIQGGRWA